MFKSKQKGFSILELGMVLVAASTITVLSVGGYNAYKKELEVTQHVDGVRYMFDIIDRGLSTSSDYSWQSTAMTFGAVTNDRAAYYITRSGGTKLLPRGINFQLTPFSIRGPLGEMNFNSRSSHVGTTDRDLLVITTVGVPRKECMAFSAKMAPHAYEIRINNTLLALTPEAVDGAIGRSEANMSHASRLCSQGNVVDIEVSKLKEINYSLFRHSGFGEFTDAERDIIEPLYNRTEGAIAAKEAAQRAIAL